MAQLSERPLPSAQQLALCFVVGTVSDNPFEASHRREGRCAETSRPPRDYFGERVSACVFTSRLCLSTTRCNSRSIVLNASWITLLSGWCEPLSVCLSSATNSWPRATVTSMRHRYGFPL